MTEELEVLEIDEIIKDLQTKLLPETLKEIEETLVEDLGKFHFSLGMWLRNTYKLWQRPWTPIIESYNGMQCDVSPYHPDAISNTIIIMLHKELKKIKNTLACE